MSQYKLEDQMYATLHIRNSNPFILPIRSLIKGVMFEIPNVPFTCFTMEHYCFSRSKYFHLLIEPTEGFISLIG